MYFIVCLYDFLYILVCLRSERILKAEIFAFIGHLGHMLKAVD